MLFKGLVDSPPDQSETLRRLQAIEKTLRVCRDGSDWEIALTADHDAILSELWELLLDVVLSPLWLRIRAAELLNVCFTLRSEYLRIDRRNATWLRSIVSSSCQILDEYDPRVQDQAASLFHWMAFLEHLLFATEDSELFHRAVFRHATYTGLLNKMIKCLNQSSTQLFAATTICLAAFYRHEIQAREAQASTVDETKRTGSVLLNVVLSDVTRREGVQHVGGALLHVINSCGYPCPSHRLSQLHDCLQLLKDILLHENSAQIIFINDFKVLMDILLREGTDLPVEDLTRLPYLELLDAALASRFYSESQFYRKHEFLAMLNELLETGIDEDSLVPTEVTQRVNRILLERIDRLD